VTYEIKIKIKIKIKIQSVALAPVLAGIAERDAA
jgi:hypothetical protein